jgi:hypothetical protein
VSQPLWRLPGPDRWLTRLVDDIEGGFCVVARLPASWAGEDLHEAVRTALASRWFEYAVCGEGSTLETTLADMAPGGGGPRAALERLAADRATGWLRVEDALPEGALDKLGQLHRHACESPPALVVEHVGGGQSSLCHPEANIRPHYLYGVLSSLDVLVHLSLAAPGAGPARRHEVAALACYDLKLGAELIAMSNPAPADYMRAVEERAADLGLRTYASVRLPDRARASRRDPRAFEELWHAGGVDLYDGGLVLHAGLLADEDVRRRLWRGQVQALLPLLDEMRLQLLDAVHRRGIFPQPGQGDVVELVDVARALEASRRHSDLTAAARELTRARNDLAHLRLVDEARRGHLRELLRRAGLAAP